MGRIRVIYNDTDEVMLCDGLTDNQKNIRIARRSGKDMISILEVPLRSLRGDMAGQTNAIVIDSREAFLEGIYAPNGRNGNGRIYRSYNIRMEKAGI